MERRGIRLTAIAAASVATMLAASACGSAPDAAGGGQGEGLPKTVTVVATMPLTGPAALFGNLSNKALELAVKEINDTHYLGSGTTLKLVTKDTAGNSSQAASLISQAVADNSVTAVFG